MFVSCIVFNCQNYFWCPLSSTFTRLMICKHSWPPSDVFQPLELKVFGERIMSQAYFKYLGGYIDYRLEFSKHFAYFEEECMKLLPKLIAICQNTCGYLSAARRTMFMATIGAIHKYACTVFGPKTLENRKSLERQDRRIQQCCAGLYRKAGYYVATAINKMPPLELQIASRYLKVCQAKGWPIHRKMLCNSHRDRSGERKI